MSLHYSETIIYINQYFGIIIIVIANIFFYTNGGTVVAVGSSGMAEKMDDTSSQAGMLIVLGETMEVGEVTLSDSNGNQLVSYETKKSYRCVTISCEGLKEGETYTLTTSGKSTEIEMTDLIYSNKSR